MRYKVLDDFDIDFNLLTNLIGSPEYIEGTFNCSYLDNLESLEGAPKFVKFRVIYRRNVLKLSKKEIMQSIGHDENTIFTIYIVGVD